MAEQGKAGSSVHLPFDQLDLKMIKRQMYGRAGLPLLRKRVQLTARG